MAKKGMGSRMRFSVGLLVVTLLVVLVSLPAYADGYVVPLYGREGDVRAPAQKAIIVYDEGTGREDIILSIKLLGESPEAAWVVPVPSLPEVNAASGDWFAQLSDVTQPLRHESRTPLCCLCCPLGWTCSAPEDGPPVEVVMRERVGLYDVSTLSADDPAALLEWLNEHDYAFPDEGEPILDSYVRDGGWYFVAVRVLPDEAERLDGDVHPLWLSFDVDEPVYPMRLTALTGGTIDVLLYVLADHRMMLKGFETEFAGELALKPEEKEEDALVSLLADQSYFVTRLRNVNYNTKEIEDDLYIQRAPNDDPYHKIVREEGGGDLRSALALSLLIGVAVVGWRMRQWRH